MRAGIASGKRFVATVCHARLLAVVCRWAGAIACHTTTAAHRLLRKDAFDVTSSEQPFNQEFEMLYWAAVFFIIALVAAVFGFTGIYAAAAGIAKILFFVFLVLFVISLLAGGLSRRPVA
jgi:uncharacterized membrane protein YtjA (UPF0391 family)